MSVNSIIVQPGYIATLGDYIRAHHLRHFSPAERLAIALYLLSQAVAEIAPEDHPGALELAAQAMAVGLAGAA